MHRNLFAPTCKLGLEETFAELHDLFFLLTFLVDFWSDDWDGVVLMGVAGSNTFWFEYVWTLRLKYQAFI